jgi:cytochrome c553
MENQYLKQSLRWVGYALAGLVGLTGLAALVVYVLSEGVLRRTYDAPVTSFHLPSDSESIAEGGRLARIRGCYNGCHGLALEGEVFFDEPGVARIVAPDLTRVVATHSNAELERVIRRGIRQNGRSVFAMPSPMFARLSDEDLSRIIAFLRSEPPSYGPAAELRVGFLGRIGLLLGEFSPLVEEIPVESQTKALNDTDEVEWGRYLALTTCSECHGWDLRGDPSGKPPNLAVAAAYSEQDWLTLLRTGKGLNGRDLGLMSQVALARFRHLTDAEARALLTYLRWAAPELARSSNTASTTQ